MLYWWRNKPTSQFHQSPTLGKSVVPVKFLWPVQSWSQTAATSLTFPHTVSTWSITCSTAAVPPCSPRTAPLPTQSGRGDRRPANAVYDVMRSRGELPNMVGGHKPFGVVGNHSVAKIQANAHLTCNDPPCHDTAVNLYGNRVLQCHVKNSIFK